LSEWDKLWEGEKITWLSKEDAEVLKVEIKVSELLEIKAVGDKREQSYSIMDEQYGIIVDLWHEQNQKLEAIREIAELMGANYYSDRIKEVLNDE